MTNLHVYGIYNAFSMINEYFKIGADTLIILGRSIVCLEHNIFGSLLERCVE